MNRSSALAAVLCLASMLPCGIFAQQSPPPAQPLPKDPVALLKLAWQQNGLHGSDLQPWHVRATWAETDQTGDVRDSGTLEEWWASEKKWKISFTSANFQQTLLMTDKGRFTAGSRDLPNWNFSLVQELLNDPLPDPARVSKSTWHRLQMKHGVVTLTCARDQMDEQYCFADELPVPRICSSNIMERGADSIVLFQGRYIARKMKILQIGLPEVDITVDQIEPLTTASDSDFSPPANAVITGSVVAPQAVEAGRRIGGNPPIYPSEAKFERVSGVVWIEATIRSDGSMGALRLLGGPPILQESAMKAVKTWHYKPYLLDGKPVDVRTRISVVYRLSSLP